MLMNKGNQTTASHHLVYTSIFQNALKKIYYNYKTCNFCQSYGNFTVIGGDFTKLECNQYKYCMTSPNDSIVGLLLVSRLRQLGETIYRSLQYKLNMFILGGLQ